MFYNNRFELIVAKSMPNVIMADYPNNEIYDQEFKRRKAYKL